MISFAKAILFSQLLISCLIILYVFLFYVQIHKDRHHTSLISIVLYILSDLLFLSSWTISFFALILRNNKCITFSIYCLVINGCIKMAALIVYSLHSGVSSKNDINMLIICLTVCMITTSVVFFFLYIYIQR